MVYAITFAILGLYLIGLACLEGSWALVLLWPGMSFLLVALAYAGVSLQLVRLINWNSPGTCR